MVRIPLPSEGLQAGITGGFTAPSVAPRQDPTGQQIGMFGRALQTAASAAQDIFQQMEDEQNLAAAQEKVALGEEEIRTHSKEYLNLLGEKAHGIGRARASQGLRNQLLKLESSLENPVQRGLYRRWLDRRMQDVESTFDRHEMKQTQVWLAGARKARIEASVDAAAQSFILLGDKPNKDGTPSAFRLQRNTAVQEARNQAKYLGLSPEETEAFVQDVTENIHRLIVEGLADSGRGSEAKEYLQGVDRKELSQDGRRRLQGVVERASVADEGARLAIEVRDQVFREHHKRLVDPKRTEPMRQQPTGAEIRDFGLNQMQMRYEAGAISLEVRDAAMAEIATMAKRRTVEEAERESTVRQNAEQWLIANPLESVAGMPASMLQEVEMSGLRGDLELFADSGHRYSTKPTYLAGLLSEQGRASLQGRDLGDFYNEARRNLSDSDLRVALALHAEVNKRARGEDFKLLTDMRRVEAGAQRMGFDADSDPDRFERLIREVERRARGLQAVGVDKITPEVLDDILHSIEVDAVYLPDINIPLLGPITVLSGPNQPYALLAEDEQEQAFVVVGNEVLNLSEIPGPRGDVPVGAQPLSVREYIRGQLVLAGEPVTQQTIAEVWVEAGRPGSVNTSWPGYQDILRLIRGTAR